MTLPAAKQLNMLDRPAREAMITLRDAASGARVAIAKYWGNDDTKQQQQALEEAVENLKLLQATILIASQHDLLDTVDVAHLSALAEQISERLS